MKIWTSIAAVLILSFGLASCGGSKKAKDDAPISISPDRDIKYLADADFNIKVDSLPVQITGGTLATYKINTGDGWKKEWMLFMRRVDRSLMLLPPVTDQDKKRPHHDYQPRIAYLVSDGETIKQALQTYLFEKYQERENFLVDLKADIIIEGDSSYGDLHMVSVLHPRDTGHLKFSNMTVVDLGEIYP